MCLCTRCVPGNCGEQMRTSDSLKLRLWMLVSHHAGAGNRAWILYKYSKRSYLMSHFSSSPEISFLVIFSNHFCPLRICLPGIPACLDSRVSSGLHWHTIGHVPLTEPSEKEPQSCWTFNKLHLFRMPRVQAKMILGYVSLFNIWCDIW